MRERFDNTIIKFPHLLQTIFNFQLTYAAQCKKDCVSIFMFLKTTIRYFCEQPNPKRSTNYLSCFIYTSSLVSTTNPGASISLVIIEWENSHLDEILYNSIIISNWNKLDRFCLDNFFSFSRVSIRFGQGPMTWTRCGPPPWPRLSCLPTTQSRLLTIRWVLAT